MELFLQCLFLHARQCTYVIITNEVDSRSTRFSFFVFHQELLGRGICKGFVAIELINFF